MTWLQTNKEEQWTEFFAEFCEETGLHLKGHTATVLLTKEEFIATFRNGFNAGFNRGVKCEKRRQASIKKQKYERVL